VFADGRALAPYRVPVRPLLPLGVEWAETAPYPQQPLELRLQRVARPDLEAAARKQCDLWAFVWASTTVLADILAGVVLSMAPRRRLRVLELGAGSGVASIAACRCGADVVATDLVPDALALIQANAAANGCRVGDAAASPDDAPVTRGRLRTRVLNLETPAAVPPIAAATGGSFDVVVGADILFAAWTVRPVVSSISAALRAGAAPPAASPESAPAPAPAPVAVIVDPGRTCRDDFEAVASEPAYGLELVARVDIPALPTAVALMRECTVFVLRLAAAATAGTRHAAMGSSGRSDVAPAGGADSDAPVAAAAVQACGALRTRADTGAAPPQLSAYGYVLPPVKE
jgi:predicted nicotinamide N-methyase